MLDPGSSRRAGAKPIEPQGVTTGDPVLRVERQKLGQRLLLTAVEYITLVFCDDEGEASDLGREVAHFDAAKVGQRDVSAAFCFAASPINFGFNRPHFLVSDDQKVTRTASRVEYPDSRHALA